MHRSILLTIVIIMTLGVCISQSRADSPDEQFKTVVDQYLKKYKPLWIESSTAWWEANTTGSKAAYERKSTAEKALVELHADKEIFAKIKALKDGPPLKDPILARELDVMYRHFLPGQADPELQKKIIAIENEVEQTFNTHRSKVGAKELSENDVRQILSETKQSKQAEEAWKGYMEVGKKNEAKLKEVVKLRNELARKLGFKNFYTMRLSLDEVDEGQLLKLFDELDELTKVEFAKEKLAMDAAMATRFGLPATELRPWHYGDLFFQATPEMPGAINLDEVYKNVDLLKTTAEYYNSMGLEVDDILARSDLYEKPGKSPHAFSTSLNREQDVRVLCNLKPNVYWADTIVHELGHAVYDKYVSNDIPFLLHEASHSITTEGYAMMMGAMVKNGDFLTKYIGVMNGPQGPGKDQQPQRGDEIIKAAQKSLRREKLIFSRWAQVMVRFEYGMYNNPDQDLGKLWWSLKAKYQMLRPPETVSRPDYAAKIHVVTNPVYYHSYMLGDLFGCQVQDYIATKVLKIDDPSKTCFAGHKEVGDYLKKNVFGPGNLYSWNELTKMATGENLSPKAFAAEYVKK